MNNKVLNVNKVSKMYPIYKQPKDRVKELLSISKRNLHTEFWAVKDISISVSQGEIIGIMGRNGAGKSTLLKIITGIVTPTSGKVNFNGRISSLLELGTGFNLEYSGIENIYLYCTLMGLNRKEIDSRLDDIIGFAEIGEYMHQPVKTYSSGMFARLAFSCAINVEADILIVDEILSVGDMRFQAKCFNKFKEYKAKGITIIYVGHDIGTMRSFCDRCIWIKDGLIEAEGDPMYISSKFIEYMYLEEDEIFENTENKELHFEEKEDTIPSDNCKDLSKFELLEKSFKTGEPLAHWGTKKGLITSFSVKKKNGEELISCGPNDEITAVIHLADLSTIDLKNFSVAISIKNKEGIDLFVNSTQDKKIKFDKLDKINSIEFKFQTNLTNGDYYLVLAVEDRREATIMYYEYIEGACYFKCFKNEEKHGLFRVHADISVT